MATEQEIRDFLRENQPAKKFTPYCYISEESDTLTAYFEGDADYSKQLNDHITLYLSLETHEIVGCRIKGISGIIQDLPNYIKVRQGNVELSVLFFAFRGGADEETRDMLNGLARVADERNIALDTVA